MPTLDTAILCPLPGCKSRNTVVVYMTLDAYLEFATEAFGQAMLRGVGWRPDVPSSAPGVHVPLRLPEGLGAIARPAPLDGKEKREKRKGDSKRRGRTGCVPVANQERV